MIAKNENVPRTNILTGDCYYRDRDRDADGDWVFYCDYENNCIYKNKQDGVVYCDKFTW